MLEISTSTTLFFKQVSFMSKSVFKSMFKLAFEKSSKRYPFKKQEEKNNNISSFIISYDWVFLFLINKNNNSSKVPQSPRENTPHCWKHNLLRPCHGTILHANEIDLVPSD